MKTRKNQAEDEEFSYLDYIDKPTLIVAILIMSFGCLVIGAIYVHFTFPQDGQQHEEPQPYHMGIIPDGHEWEYNATHVWKKGEE